MEFCLLKKDKREIRLKLFNLKEKRIQATDCRRKGLALGLFPCSVTNGLNLLNRCETIV